MPEHSFRYGLRAGGEGYGIISRSDTISSQDAKTLEAFCKRIRFSPDKLDEPEASCLAFVPSPHFYWLCRIDETRDDKNRALAFDLHAEGFRRNNAQAMDEVKQAFIRESEGKKHLEFNVGNGDGAVILTNAHLLHYELQPKRRSGASYSPPINHAPSSPPDSKEVPMQQFKANRGSAKRNSPFAILLAALIGASAAGASLWFLVIEQRDAVIRQQARQMADIEGEATASRDELSRYKAITIEQFGGTGSADHLLRGIRNLNREIETLDERSREMQEQQRLADLYSSLTKEQLADLRVITDTVTLRDSLNALIDAAENVLKHMSTVVDADTDGSGPQFERTRPGAARHSGKP